MLFSASPLPVPHHPEATGPEQAALQGSSQGSSTLPPLQLGNQSPTEVGGVHERSEDSSEELVLSFHLHVDSGG